MTQGVYANLRFTEILEDKVPKHVSPKPRSQSKNKTTNKSSDTRPQVDINQRSSEMASQHKVSKKAPSSKRLIKKTSKLFSLKTMISLQNVKLSEGLHYMLTKPFNKNKIVEIFFRIIRSHLYRYGYDYGQNTENPGGPKYVIPDLYKNFAQHM